MDFDPAELDSLSREDLILRARARGVERPEQMTRVELRDEIVRLSEPDLERQRRSRGWLGVARDLLASVVESGLNLPDAAASIRGDGSQQDFQGPPPVATVTLAEIYAAQGHYEQALRMLDEVIEREPEHAVARNLRERIAEERDLGPGRRRKVVETKGDPILTPQAPAVAPIPEAIPVVAAQELSLSDAPKSSPAVSAAPVAFPSAPVPALEEPEPQPAPAEPTLDEPSSEAEPAPVALEEPATTAAAPAALETAPAAMETAPAAIEAAPAAVESAPAAVETAQVPEVEPPPVIQAAALVLQLEGRAFVYWRVPHLSDSLCLRSITVRPSVTGPALQEEDFPLRVHVGGIWLSRGGPGTEVRAAVGELSAEAFSPHTVARVVSADETLFEPPGFELDLELEEAARRAAGLG